MTVQEFREAVEKSRAALFKAQTTGSVEHIADLMLVLALNGLTIVVIDENDLTIPQPICTTIYLPVPRKRSDGPWNGRMNHYLIPVDQITR